MEIAPDRSGLRRAALRIVGVLVATYAALLIMLFAMQERFIFLPQLELTAAPQDYGCDQVEEVRIGRHKLFGWVLKGDQPTSLIYHHGNAGNVGANAEHACRLNKMGFTVLVFDYRGYGKSEGGFPSERTAYEDAEAAWTFMRTRSNEPIVLYGHSLGAAIAIESATRHPEAAGLIAESAFTSVYDVGAAQPSYRFIPLRLILTQKFDSLAKIKAIRMPALFLHGEADSLIPPEMSRRLFTAANEPKRLVTIPGGGHDNSAAADPPRYRGAVVEFVRSITAQRKVAG